MRKSKKKIHATYSTSRRTWSVMIRGIERRNIFRNKKDREDFLERQGRLLPETGTACYGWAFLSNHAHFLLAQTFKMSVPGIGYAVERGKKLTKKNMYSLQG